MTSEVIVGCQPPLHICALAYVDGEGWKKSGPGAGPESVRAAEIHSAASTTTADARELEGLRSYRLGSQRSHGGEQRTAFLEKPRGRRALLATSVLGQLVVSPVTTGRNG